MPRVNPFIQTNNHGSSNPYRIRYGRVLLMAAMMAYIVVNRGDVYEISRQAAAVVQEAADHGLILDMDLSTLGAPENRRNNKAVCPLYHTAKLSTPSLVIDKNAVRAQSNEALVQMKQFTTPEYEQYMTALPGQEHYTLWHYLTKNFHDPADCRHVVDIGTRYVASALALGATGIPVTTFDIPNSSERTHAFRQKTEEQWQQQLTSGTNAKIQFFNIDLLAVSDQEFRQFMSTWLVVLDTFHLPYSVQFEREFLDRLVNMEKPKFEGIVMLDDIHFNDEMKQWWKEVQDTAHTRGYVAHDLTSVGHLSGTGLLDFSGNKVTITE